VLELCDLVLVMTVNPGFGGQKLIERAFPKIEALRRRIEARGLSTLIEVDGGVKAENAGRFTAAGAHILVAGSGVFGLSDRAAAIAALRQSAAASPWPGA
jgi:ribulose-phosphate 3-epimerase